MKPFFQCEKCKKMHEIEADAIACESKPEPIFHYKVGDTVFIYSPYAKQHYAQKVVSAFVWKHEAAYELDMLMDIGDRLTIGAGESNIVDENSSFDIYEGYDYIPAMDVHILEYDPNIKYYQRHHNRAMTVYKP